MAIVAKMRCNKVETGFMGYEDSDGQDEPTVLLQEDVLLDAVHSDDPDDPNNEWSKWTPSGQLHMVISNPAAQRYLQTGVEYYVEIRKVQPTKARNLQTDDSEDMEVRPSA